MSKCITLSKSKEAENNQEICFKALHRPLFIAMWPIFGAEPKVLRQSFSNHHVVNPTANSRQGSTWFTKNSKSTLQQPKQATCDTQSCCDQTHTPSPRHAQSLAFLIFPKINTFRLELTYILIPFYIHQLLIFRPKFYVLLPCLFCYCDTPTIV